ncbi:MAG TPA: thioredoxin domain-containing protein [Anaerolineaceae bacterium]|nr:thioredoxin domain-containing protein [Anaerolineaceae bacterium]
MSKRDELREKRRKAERRNRIVWIVVISIVVVAVVAAFVVPAAIDALTPVTDIKTITPKSHPQANGNSMGDPNAPVKVEEFSDFQCPFCKKYTDEMEQGISDKYVKTGKVYFTYTSWPFIGTESDQSAKAALCASEQGKFWDMHDIIFANQGQERSGALSDKRLKAMAQSIGLDMGKFNACFSSDKYDSQIAQDKVRGDQLGIVSTPSFIVNGKMADLNTLSQTIDGALAAK